MSCSLSCAKLTAWTFAAVLLQILGLSLFVIGFFPVKPTLPGKSGLESYRMPTCDPVSDSVEGEIPPDQLRSLCEQLSQIPPAYDRLILMVVDGLPAEFVLGRDGKPPTKSLMEAMPYTQALLSDASAIAYHAKAAPPTVTMPRLKAMVSGAIGGFLDVAFNFNTQAFLDDNLFDQFYRIGWKMVMLGDDTWIKLFPGIFTRKDGVSSFYVKDTIEVDYNVSRHLENELAAKDWKLLILHYLGLDHVGHIGGRHSALMIPKLKEMDDVVKMIHRKQFLHQDKYDSRTLLVVVSDHGMTDAGNHGGSSYEETDSLALFIGGEASPSQYSPKAHNAAFQVDIAPTLAILLGVPIPKNNVGVLLIEVLNSLTDKQKLRALELNSWQLLRLLQAHLPGLLCGDLSCSHDSQVSGYDIQEKLCHLLSKATSAHHLLQPNLRNCSFKINNTDDLDVAVTLYYDFLRNASEWLSQRATDKPINLLLSGVSVMVISCILLLNLLFCLFKEVYSTQKQLRSQIEVCGGSWKLDEAFILLGFVMYVLSLSASSMVEEEQYTWHFLVSTLYLLFLFMSIRSLFKQRRSGSIDMEGDDWHALHKERTTSSYNSSRLTDNGISQFISWKDYYEVLSVLVVLICGRILRGWHQGGINWVNLPDISKLLEQAGISSIKSFQIISLLLLAILNLFSAVLVKSYIINVVNFSHLVCGLLILLHVLGTWGNTAVLMNYGSTSIAQLLYLFVIVTMVLTLLSLPWNLPIQHERNMSSCSTCKPTDSVLLGTQGSTYLIGKTYMTSWCLLQLLLQQPVNAVPVLLIFLQLTASMIYFSANRSRHRQWVEVAALYFLGIAGHFGLGNSNSLATIDVAGAFIGISSHSSILSGILMFIITYASPLFSFLSLVMSISTKDIRYFSGPAKSNMSSTLQTMIAFPCLLPLVLNSIVLATFTIILLLMRNHLFVWSVFSPKYLYVCAATVSVYIGVSIIAATGVYVCTVFFFRANMFKSNITTS